MPISKVRGLFKPLIDRVLVSTADKIATSARGKAKTKRIASAIEVGVVQETGDGRSTITVGIDLEKAPEGAAYEFGSGLWGPEGQKYPILPKNGKFLKFPWPQASNIGPGRPPGSVSKSVVNADGMAYLPGVMHPGVKPEPALIPALEENIGFFQEKVLGVTVESIIDSLGPRVEIIR